MTDILAADVNRTGLQSLEAPDAFETGGSFVVELRNHGEATHVHLHLDDTLSEIAHVEATNHYVEAGSTRPVQVEVADLAGLDRPTRGKLKVVTAYGAQTHFVDVTLDPTEAKPAVEIDPELTESPDQGGEADDALAVMSALPAVVLGGVALVLAIGAVVAPTQGLLFGLLAVLSGALAAAYIAVN